MNSSQLALRAVMILAERGSITLSELALALDVAPATAHRVLANCRETGFASQHERGGAYTVGPAVHELTLILTQATGLRDAAGPVLRRLVEQTGETVSVGVIEGRSIRFVQAISGTSEVAVGPRVGTVRPAHCTAIGKALLSHETPEQLEARYRGSPLLGATPRSITSWPRLHRQFAQARYTGWAYSLGESDISIAAIAAPIVLSTGRATSAVSIAAPIWRMQTRDELLQFADDLLAATDVIQQRLRGIGE
ncbi:IclR family transcriptional regulator [Microbacterium sp. 18062]|uniref:IclR family transcriptional regulator n=1 Tax=Microbacterium sp. 18062 TaxID=2681410 RepID=UPI00135A9C09|nr:IclR family transcriptional regulator [Microbacterium sp. 18062]